jgi:KipI family sensor histidine kinase inhibitor
MMEPTFFPVLPSALLMTVGDRIDVELTRRIARFCQCIERSPDISVQDIVPSYTTILVLYDPHVNDVRTVSTALSLAWKELDDTEIASETGFVTIPVVYGDEFGEDLEQVARFTGLPADEVIRRHEAAIYTVGALGFAPGFTYLVGLPPELTTPRKDRPRLRVPTGSVGIGGSQAGIYALPTAGGWNLIGRTPFPLFDRTTENPVRLRMGDQIRFRRMDASGWREPAVEPVMPDQVHADGSIEVVAPGMQTTVQDLGRIGFGSTGFAPNGAADRSSMIAANLAVGNDATAPVLEMTLSGPHLRFHRRMSIAIVGAQLKPMLNGLPLSMGREHDVMPGDELAFRGATSGMRAYLSVGGGIIVPAVMTSAATDLTAGIGGYAGRALLAGDRLDVGIPRQSTLRRLAPRWARDERPFRVMPGPQRSAFSDETWDRLLSGEFTVTQEANRVGIRLGGPSLAPENGADIISEGIVTGSIQVTGEGQSIVMLPGHATIGGYTKIATVIEDDWDRLGQLAPGDTVRFTSV